ncbi:hypothetical protein ACVGXN_24690 [Enterobacter hormaechei]|nr:hypothetical protein Y59_13170 [Enterobacter hormaechei]CZZ77002.1 Uncharacterised protein [Enterobacter hormaechei]
MYKSFRRMAAAPYPAYNTVGPVSEAPPGIILTWLPASQTTAR